MPRLTISLPEELGPTPGAVRTHANTSRRVGQAVDPDPRPRIVRWLACWAGGGSGLERL
jgi:hypothetical protein